MSRDDAPRSTAEIQSDLAASRAKLVAGVQGLVDDITPKNIAKRAVNDAKTFVSTEFENAKAQVKDESGWRLDRIVPIAGAAVGAVAFVVTIRAIVNASRGRKLTAKPLKQLNSK